MHGNARSKVDTETGRQPPQPSPTSVPPTGARTPTSFRRLSAGASRPGSPDARSIWWTRNLWAGSLGKPDASSCVSYWLHTSR